MKTNTLKKSAAIGISSLLGKKTNKGNIMLPQASHEVRAEFIEDASSGQFKGRALEGLTTGCITTFFYSDFKTGPTLDLGKVPRGDRAKWNIGDTVASEDNRQFLQYLGEGQQRISFHGIVIASPFCSLGKEYHNWDRSVFIKRYDIQTGTVNSLSKTFSPPRFDLGQKLPAPDLQKPNKEESWEEGVVYACKTVPGLRVLYTGPGKRSEDFSGEVVKDGEFSVFKLGYKSSGWVRKNFVKTQDSVKETKKIDTKEWSAGTVLVNRYHGIKMVFLGDGKTVDYFTGVVIDPGNYPAHIGQKRDDWFRNTYVEATDSDLNLEQWVPGDVLVCRNEIQIGKAEFSFDLEVVYGGDGDASDKFMGVVHKTRDSFPYQFGEKRSDWNRCVFSKKKSGNGNECIFIPFFVVQ